MNLSHRLLSSALLAGAVFSVAALPLTTLGSKPVTIQLEEKPIFVGQLRELAGPYLALATGISLGVGAVSLAVSSWRYAAHKLERREAEIAALKQQLTEKTSLVERLRFSDAKLHSSGLEQFLQAEETIALRSVSPAASMPPAPIPNNTPRLSRPEIARPVSDFDRPIAPPAPSKFSTAGLAFFLDDDLTLPEPSDRISANPALPAANPAPTPTHSASTFKSITEPVKIQAVSSLPAAQSFKGFVRPDPATEAAAPSHYQSEQSTQLNELLGHLKQVMTQIERLHTAESPAPRNRSGL